MKRQKPNKIKYSVLLLLVVICFLLLSTGVLADDGDDYIVTLKDGVDASTLFEKTYDLTQLTEVDHGIYATDAANAAKLEDNPLVDSVVESQTRTLMLTANDTQYVAGNQWALSAIDATGGWDITTGSNNVTVVVIDTGFTYNHEDNGNVTAGMDYITDATNTYDCDTHGTATAGLIGAATNNALGITAACWNINVVMLRAFYVSTINGKEEVTADDADIISALYAAVDTYDADVISMSFGGTKVDSALGNAIQYAYDKGAILVAAAGNSRDENSPLEYPAAYADVIGVAAVKSSLVTDYYSTANSSVYVSAPGSSVKSLANPNYGSAEKPLGDAYGYFNGTSFATPYVAGLAAMARSIDPDITEGEFKYYLRHYSDDIETTGYDINSGYGLIDYAATLNAIKADESNTMPAGSGSASNPYLISNESELDWFNVKVGSGSSTVNARLTADITITDPDWNPMEDFNGTFNGAGHTIDMGTNNNGLFDTIGTNGSVKDLTVAGTIVNESNAALIATENDGTISGCTAKGSVSGTYTAGICALNYGTIIRSVNNATVSGSGYTGGIAALTSGGNISYSYNTGKISSATSMGGGICAYAKSSATISSCYNTGNVSGSITSRGIIAKNSASTVSYCFYDSNIITGGSSSTTICGKDSDFMKTSGFVCLLNNGKGYFATDTGSTNNGYPVLTGSNLTTYFTDVAINNWYTNYVYNLTAKGIVAGEGDNLFCPDDTITRAEFTAILARASGADLSTYAGKTAFTDVGTSKWYATAIEWAYENNIVSGMGGGLFCPDNQITREEITLISTRFIEKMTNSSLSSTTVLTFSDSGAIASWAKESVAIMVDKGYIVGFPDRTFQPKENATRAEAAVIITKVLNDVF